MSNRVETICRFHTTRSFGSRQNLIARSQETNQTYRELTQPEIAELIQRSLTDGDELIDALASLACLSPGSLKPFHRQLIEHGIVYPGVIYHDADEQCSAAFADLMVRSDDSLSLNHLLLCLAWAGNRESQRVFARWRDSAPAWAANLHGAPHSYAQEAGWELLPNGERRDLYFRTAFPLVRPDSAPEVLAGLNIGISTDQRCRWCGRQLVSLFDFDATFDTLSFLNLPSARLRTTTCDVCSAFGVMFFQHSDTGDSTWHPANVRPSYLPDDSANWPKFPERPLVFTAKQRHFMDSACWTYVPGVAFSGIGGLPTWIQDAEYPDCLECSKKMLFIGQISNQDFDPLMEGIEYCFICPQCNVTATSYQQS